MSFAALTRETKRNSSAASLSISQPNDAFEHEADHVEDEVIAGDVKRHWSLSSIGIGASLQRKCACGGTPGPTGECEECRKKRLQRKAQQPAPGTRNESTVPPIIGEVLRSPGQALDITTRRFLEPRFGHDFSRVRVHTDLRAAQSARAVNALAYTAGHEIVFGAGQFRPSTTEGRRLLAHELAHTIQQQNQMQVPNELRLDHPDSPDERKAMAVANAMAHPTADRQEQVQESVSHAQNGGVVEAQIQRACLPAAVCAPPRSTLTQFVAETESKPENVTKASKRRAACTKAPPDPSCTSDGHGSLATALTAILAANYPSRAGYITGIYVNKDMPADWGAVTGDCANFMPPLPGGKCTSVPDQLEAEGKLYRGGSKTIAGRSRQDWLTATIGTLTHETEHARFDTAAPIAPPSPTACKFDDLKDNLSEMAAHLSEMHVYYRDALARPGKDRFKHFYKRFDFWVKNGSEDISGIVKDLRCKCECADADHFISKTVESVGTNQKWDSNESFMIHTELRQPKWALDWPVAPPAVDIADIPSTAAGPLKF